MKGRRRFMGSEEPFDGFLVRGKWYDTSNSDYWNCMIDGEVVDLKPYTDSYTKEFEYWQKDKPKSLEDMFGRNSSSYRNLEVIYEMRGTEECMNMRSIFSNNRYIKYMDLSGVDSSKNNSFFNAFYFTFYLGGSSKLVLNLDFDKATNTANIFAGCSALVNVQGTIRNIKRSLDIKVTPLTNESAMVFINGLAEVESPQTITFSAATYATLTPEQIALAESKNWIVAKA